MADQLIMAQTPEEAIAANTASAAFLAGGTEVNRLGSDIASEAETLISLKKCSGLSDIRKEEGCVSIGAMCTFQQIVESDDVPSYLKEAARFMASRTKRNMATIGGNIAACRSDSYLIPTLIAAGAVLELTDNDRDGKRVSIEGYLGSYEKYGDDLITAVIVPAEAKVISRRYANTAQSHAVLTMSAALTDDGFVLAGAVKNSGIIRFTDFEDAVKGNPSMNEDDIIQLFRGFEELPLEDDMFGSGEYKRYLMGVTASDLYKKLTA